MKHFARGNTSGAQIFACGGSAPAPPPGGGCPLDPCRPLILFHLTFNTLSRHTCRIPWSHTPPKCHTLSSIPFTPPPPPHPLRANKYAKSSILESIDYTSSCILLACHEQNLRKFPYFVCVSRTKNSQFWGSCSRFTNRILANPEIFDVVKIFLAEFWAGKKKKM